MGYSVGEAPRLDLHPHGDLRGRSVGDPERRRRQLKLRPALQLTRHERRHFELAFDDVHDAVEPRERRAGRRGLRGDQLRQTNAPGMGDAFTDDVDDLEDRRPEPVRRLRDVIHPQREGMRESFDCVHRGQESIHGG